MGLISESFSKLSFPVQYVVAVTIFVTSSIGARGLYNYYSGMIMNSYRDKSALYGRELKPGERPSWPRWP